MEIKMTRVFARANAETFKIKSVAKLLSRYMNSNERWADPFAGKNSPAIVTNDINPEMPTQYHLEAENFCEIVEGTFDGILFDPPYSYRQITEHYKFLGMKATQKDTSYNFYRRVMNIIIPKIKINGYAISFGWNSNGFGKSYGFNIVEILLIAHGLHHNDTIVTVEQLIEKELG